MDKITYFSNAQPAKPLRKLAAYVLDFIIAFIVMIGLFAIEEGISNATSEVKQTQTQINEVYQEMKRLSVSSKLAVEDEQNRLIGQDEIVTNYLYGATYATLKQNDDDTISESLYSKYTPIDNQTDNAYFYYVSFKGEHLEDFNKESQAKAGVTYYRETLNRLTMEEYYVSVTESEYPSLTLKTAKALNEYFINNSYQVGYQIYQTIKAGYLQMLKDGIKDIQLYYGPFVALQDRHLELSNKLYNVKTIELIIAYILAIAIVYLLLPILLKEGRTLAFKIMFMGVVNNKEEKLTWYNYLIKYVMNLIELLPMIALNALVFFGASAVELVGRNLFGDVSFLSIAMVMSLVSLVDFLLSFVMLKSKQTITELFAMEIVKDGKAFNTIQEKELA